MAADTRVSITVDTGSAESSLNRLRTALDNVDRATDETGQGIRQLEDNANNASRGASRLSKALDGFKTLGQAAGIALGAVGFALKGAVDESIKFESAMADVKKVVNFDSPQGLADMRKELEQMSSKLPIAFDGLAKIAAAAGQSGIAAGEIIKFTEAAAKMGTAFDISTDEAGQAMAEMRTAFKMSQTDVETLADKINYLGNNSPNNAAKIMKIVQTVGPLGKLAGVSADQIAAMGASVNSLAPEVVATGLKNMFLALTKGESATKSASDAFKKLGLDAVQVSKDMQTDSVGTINKIIEALKQLPAAAQTSTINDIFGAEALPVIAQMVTNTEGLNKNLRAMGDSTAYAGSMQAEFAAKAGTSANSIALFKNNVALAKAAVGDALLPALNQLMTTITPLMQQFTTWAQQNPQTVTTILAVTGAVLGTVTALGAIALAVTAVTSGWAALTAIGGGLAAVMSAISLPVLAVVAAIGALVAAGVYLYQNWDIVKAKAQEVFNSLPQPVQEAVANIKSIITGLGEVLGKVFDVMLPIAQFQFNALKSIVTTAWAAIKGLFSANLSAIQAVMSAGLSVISSVFNAQFAVIKAIVTTTLNVIKALAQGDMQAVKAAFVNGFNQIVSAVKTMASNILGAFRTLGSQMVAIGGEVISGLINGIRARAGAVVAEAQRIASSIASTIKSALDIHSPSRVTHALGEHAGQGLANGLKAKTSEVAKQAEQLAKQVSGNIASIKKEVAVMQDGSTLADINYDVKVGKYAGVSPQLIEELKNVTLLKAEYMQTKKDLDAFKQAQDGVNNSIADLSKQIALIGRDNPLSSLLYDISNTQKYAGVSKDSLNTLIAKYRELNAVKQGQEATKAFTDLQTGMTQETPAQRMAREYQEKLAVIDTFERLHTDKVAEAAALRNSVNAQYTQASQNMMLDNYQTLFGGLADLTQSFAGKQAGIYKGMFVAQRAFAIAQAGLNMWKAGSSAYADTPGTVWQKLGAAAMAVAKGGQFVSLINAIKPPAIGQAHDGIMSVPKSGTWNLEKGERVLPSKTAAAMDKKLENSSNTNIQINNYSSAKVETRQENGLTIFDVKNVVDEHMKSQMSNPNSTVSKSIYRNTNARPQR